MKEIWKDIPDYEGIYQASNFGNIKRTKTNKVLKVHVGARGYCMVSLSFKNVKKQKSVHRIIAKTFLPNTNKTLQVNHINGIKTDNRIENLEWCTSSENIKHAFKYGLKKTTEKQRLNAKKAGKSRAKKIVQYDTNGNYIKTWNSATEASKKLEISNTAIGECLRERNKTAKGFVWRYEN